MKGLASVSAFPTPSGLVAKMMMSLLRATSFPSAVALHPMLCMSFLRSSFLDGKEQRIIMIKGISPMTDNLTRQ
jgi:hypothetical protein